MDITADGKSHPRSLTQALFACMQTTIGVKVTHQKSHTANPEKQHLLRHLARAVDSDIVEEAKAARESRGVTGRDTLAFEGKHDSVAWSDDAPRLVEIIAASNPLDPAPEYRTVPFLRRFFTDLKLNDMKVEEVGEDFSHFNGVKKLSICCNKIKQIRTSHLPPGLTSLQAMGNTLEEIVAEEPLLSLKHAALSYNCLRRVPALSHWAPHIMSLDLGWNDICDLPQVMACLKPAMESLQHLSLFGNPCSLVKNYGGVVISSFSRLESLDKTALHLDVREQLTATRVSDASTVVFELFVSKVAGMISATDVFSMLQLAPDGAVIVGDADKGKGAKVAKEKAAKPLSAKGKPATEIADEADAEAAKAQDVTYSVRVTLPESFSVMSSQRYFTEAGGSDSSRPMSRPASAKSLNASKSTASIAKGGSRTTKDDKKAENESSISTTDFTSVTWNERVQHVCEPSLKLRDAIKFAVGKVELVETRQCTVTDDGGVTTEDTILASSDIKVDALFAFSLEPATKIELDISLAWNALPSGAKDAVAKGVQTCQQFHTAKAADEAAALELAASGKKVAASTAPAPGAVEPVNVTEADSDAIVQRLFGRAPVLGMSLSRILR